MNFEKNSFLSALKCIGVTISLVVKNNPVFNPKKSFFFFENILENWPSISYY